MEVEVGIGRLQKRKQLYFIYVKWNRQQLIIDMKRQGTCCSAVGSLSAGNQSTKALKASVAASGGAGPEGVEVPLLKLNTIGMSFTKTCKESFLISCLQSTLELVAAFQIL